LTLNQEFTAPELSTLLVHLTLAVERMPQLLEQIAGQIQRRGDEGTVRMDNGQPVGRAVGLAHAYLWTARADAGTLALSMGEARALLYRMGTPPSEDD
jgi:hypothetical protein